MSVTDGNISLPQSSLDAVRGEDGDTVIGDVFDFVFYLAVLLYSIALLDITLTFPWETALTPLITLAILILLSGLGIVLTTFKYFKVIYVDESADVNQVKKMAKREADEYNYWRFFAYIGIICVFVLFIVQLGIFTAIFLMTLIQIYYNKHSPLLTLASALALMVALYALFITILGYTILVRDDFLFTLIDSVIDLPT